MKKGKLIAIVLVCVVLAGAAGYAVMAKGESSVDVKVFNARKDDILSTVSATGVVKEQSSSNVYINTPFKVTKVNVEKGENVKKGDVLAELDTASVRIQLQQAKVSYSNEKISLENLRKNTGIMSTLQAENAVDSAKMEIRQKQVLKNEAQKNYENSKSLLDTGSISKSDLDKSKQAYDSAVIDLEAANLKLVSLEKELKNANEDKSRAAGDKRAQIDMQENRVSVAELKVKELEENIKDVDIESGKVIAPADGCIASIGINEGDYTKVNEAAFSIVNLSELIINAKISESDIKDIKIGNKVEISGDSIDPEKYEGTVKSIAPVAKKEVVDKTEQTVVDVEIQVVSKGTILKPGFNVDIKIQTKSMKNVLSVINDAVKEDKEGKKFVYVVENGVAREIGVDIIIESELYAGIKENKDGIAEKSKVIYNSSESLKSGTPVKVIQEK
ncbi:MAG: efflux RND transporter periplasmic adaptor subunit [Clostridia bacterium]|nr:efflux RND transporter periplasmic adaptor subunit [Clostridia bacterium]